MEEIAGTNNGTKMQDLEDARTLLRRCLRVLEVEQFSPRLCWEIKDFLIETKEITQDPEPVKEIMHTMLGTKR